MSKKVVIVGTSAPYLKEHPTGLWIEEMAASYYTFLEAGFEVTIASPKGGPIPIDEGSLTDPFFTEVAKKFMHDSTAVGKLTHSTALTDINFETDADAIFMTGGHGVCADFDGSPALKAAIETLYESDKVVAAVCHGAVCLAQCVKKDGTPLVAGKTVTGFSNSEEDAIQKSDLVPFLIETKFKELGATYESTGDWGCKVCVDGKLVTGQNPSSTEETAKAVIKMVV